MLPSRRRGTNSDPSREATTPPATTSSAATARTNRGRPVATAQHRDERIRALRGPLQECGAQRRHEREREHERAEEREDDGQRHRAEQLPLDALEREDRQVDDEDDQLAEHRRAPDLDRGLLHDLPHAAAGGVLTEAPDGVLDHDHRAVDDEPEVDGAEAHQGPGDADLQHAVDRKAHRQRDRRRHDQPRADVAEEREQDRHHEERAEQQVLLDGVQHAVDQVGPLVDGGHLDARRQRPAHLLESQLESPRDVVAILSHEHEPEAEHYLALAVGGHRPAADLAALDHARDVADPRGDALAGAHDDVADVRRARDDADALNEARLPGLVDRPAADVGVVALERLGQFPQRQVVLREPARVDDDLDLPLVASPRVDLGDARDRS